ncbi:MAG: riboflavin synthase, partial [Euryarchaeota archaeon]|nr:riboflavin synthase [Euryarchaeota archaeon]
FNVCLIPETLRRTTFGFKKEGDFVNFEIEANTKAIVDSINRKKGD